MNNFILLSNLSMLIDCLQLLLTHVLANKSKKTVKLKTKSRFVIASLNWKYSLLLPFLFHQILIKQRKPYAFFVLTKQASVETAIC